MSPYGDMFRRPELVVPSMVRPSSIFEKCLRTCFVGQRSASKAESAQVRGLPSRFEPERRPDRANA